MAILITNIAGLSIHEITDLNKFQVETGYAEYDLTQHFTHEEIRRSSSLASLLTAGDVSLKDTTYKPGGVVVTTASGLLQIGLSQDTDDVSEGSVNLYFTENRVQGALNNLSIGDLSDIDLGSPITDEHVLAYNSGSGSFEPVPIAPAPVTSVNSQIGIVVLDADDISDAATANKFVTSSDLTNLGNLSGTNTGDEVTFTGAGTSGNVPDPITSTGKVLSDSGVWIAGGGDLISTNNLSDVANATTSFDNIKQSATEIYSGVVELASQAEVDAGADANKAVTPATLSGSAVIPDNPRFGGEYDFVSSDTRSDSTATTLQTKVTLTTGSLPLGTYMISWQAELAGSATNRTMRAQITDNTATVVGENYFRPTNSDEWASFSGMIQQNISGVNVFTMTYSALVGGTASIRRARIALWRVG